MYATEPVNPFTSPILAFTCSNLVTAQAKVESFPRDKLVNSFRLAFHTGKRAVCLLCADALIARGIPPAFWHSHLSRTDYSLEKRFDLFVYDVRWLRATYPYHARKVRYNRHKIMLTGIDKKFWAEVEYAFYAGRRPTWKLVRSFSLNEQQQTDCWLLRSARLARRLQSVTDRRNEVFEAIKEGMTHVRKTAKFTKEAAEALILRRHQVWLCGQMAKKKPSETARRFQQLTGISLTRQLVAKHLEKADSALIKN